jgi:hypothetical protein
MKLKIIAASFALTLGAGLALTAPSTAFADTKDGSPASCRGFESQIVPAGSSLNEPDGQQSFLAFVDSLIGRTVNGVLIVPVADLSHFLLSYTPGCTVVANGR